MIRQNGSIPPYVYLEYISRDIPLRVAKKIFMGEQQKVEVEVFYD